MTTAQIFFSFVAAALVLAGGFRVIRGGLEQMIPAAPLGQSGVFVWMLVRGENPVDVTFRWIFFLALCGFFYWLHEGKLKFAKPSDDESDPHLGEQSSVVEVLRRAVRNK
jgi:dolichol kinase